MKESLDESEQILYIAPIEGFVIRINCSLPVINYIEQFAGCIIDIGPCIRQYLDVETLDCCLWW